MRAILLTGMLVACSQAPNDTGPIVVGTLAPLTGVNQMFGLDMKTGIQLAIDEQNEAGGIAGRSLVLTAIDDGDDPMRADQAARVLVDAQPTNAAPVCPSTTGMGVERGPGAVLAIIGAAGGEATIAASALVAVESGTLYFGAANGMTRILRDTETGSCARFIFNFRASLAQEALATTTLLQRVGVPGFANLISFDEGDDLGDLGYNAVIAAYPNVYGAPLPSTTAIARFRYTRNDDTSVPASATAAETYLESLLAAQTGKVTVGVVMTDTYGASADFIQLLREWQFAASAAQTQYQMATRLELHFGNLSSAAANALSDRLVSQGVVATPTGMMPLTTDVYVSEVVPNYLTDTSDIVTTYKNAIEHAGVMPGFTSLEGYWMTRVFLAGLLAHHGAFTPDGLIADFEHLNGFVDHQYTPTVWGTQLQPDGSFASNYAWTADGTAAGSFTSIP